MSEVLDNKVVTKITEAMMDLWAEASKGEHDSPFGSPQKTWWMARRTAIGDCLAVLDNEGVVPW
jgi:hypothetical protein